jgi:uncharacterized DUF497 family protein
MTGSIMAQSGSLLGVLEDRPVVIAHAPNDDGSRIISMRKANCIEKRTYQERFGTD